ncbi:MAG: CDP-diacylglycerol--glycerol-3-phosphate 3-phosphatidyltransferase [Eubacteriales bacterium]|nr:CDP-diacylglycerol--glycerol-3-phosphate 3-phosphatidyltransferase [Eubacteriales bacterium]
MNLPNKLTILRILLVPVIVVLFYLAAGGLNVFSILSAILFTAAAITDTLDGQIARRNGNVTLFGKFIDPIADKLLVMSALILLTADGSVNPIVTIVLIGREFVISGFRLIASTKGTVISAGWPGKIKTIVQYVAIVLLMLNDFPFFYIGVPLGEILIYISLALSIWSCGEYFYKNKAVASEIMRDLK